MTKKSTLLTRAAMTLVLALLFPLWAAVGQLHADQVTSQQARQQAQAFLNSRTAAGGGPRHAPGVTPQLMQERQVSGLYVFNISNEGGFVIVSGDDVAEPILGYADSGSLDVEKMPGNMRAWLQGYADEIAWAKEHGITTTEAQKSSTARAPRRIGSHATTAISPLLTTKWNQGTPYNNLCPEYQTGKKSVTGCVATAMAQAMYYTETKAGNSTTTTTADIPAYTSSSNHLSLEKIDAGTVINWGNMINSYANGAGTDAQKLAVAQLMLYCGCSVEMDYGSSSGSNTILVAEALKAYFNYASTVQCVSRSYYTYANWTDMIYNELSQGRPVVYGGQSSGGGHEFVCDGYKFENSTDYFHINWGWGGQSDNYFVLSALNPSDQGIGGSSSDDGFNYGQDAVVGIQKTGGSGMVLDLASDVSLTINSITLSKSNIAHGETVTITVNVTNNSTDVYDGELCLVVNNNLGDGKMFEIDANATSNCSFEFTPVAAGSYIFKCAFPTKTGGYSWNNTPSATLRVDDKTPYELNASDITPLTAVVGWTSDATKWNLKYRPLTISEMDFSDGLPTGWRQFAQSTDYWLITSAITLGGSITFWAGGEGTSGKFRVYVDTGEYYTSASQEFTATSTRKEYTVDLSSYSGTSTLAFIISDASSNTADIDNFTIVEPGAWTTVNNVTTNPSTLTELTPETHYEVQVQAIIDDATTEWSDPLIFETPNVIPADIAVVTTSQTATVSWSSAADSYELRYGVIPEDAVINRPATWLQYDNGVCATNYSTTGEKQEYTWGVMYPGSQVTGNVLTKVAVYENSGNTGDITVTVYTGGDTAPGTKLYTETFATLKNGFHEVTLASPVTITPGQNLWITLTETAQYPFTCSEGSDANSRWVMSGSNWYQMNISYGFMIRGYIETTDFGDSDIAWTTVTCTDNTYRLTGLTAETDYVLQVRGIYDGSTTTAWVQQTFTTTSNVIELVDGSATNSDLITVWNSLTATVTLTGRTLYKDGEWNTICLPFNVVLEGSPLEGAEAKTLVDATMTGTHVTLTFGDAVTTLNAGTPYIIKWDDGDAIVNPVFTDVTVVGGSAADRAITQADGNVKFIGYYDAFGITAADDNIYYMTAGSTLKHTGKQRTLKACRAYFQFTEAASARSFVLDFGNGEVTGITTTNFMNDTNSNAWYTLDGRRLDKQPAQPGIYVNSGKKVVIK